MTTAAELARQQEITDALVVESRRRGPLEPDKHRETRLNALRALGVDWNPYDD